MIDQFVPPSVDLSISYPVIAEPPLFDGAVQERLICDEENVVAINPVGGDVIVTLVVPAKEERPARYWLNYDGKPSYGFGSVWSVM